MKGVIQYSHFRFKEDSSNDDYVWRVSCIEFHPNTVSVSSCMFLFSLTLIIFYFCEQDIVSGWRILQPAGRDPAGHSPADQRTRGQGSQFGESVQARPDVAPVALSNECVQDGGLQ